MNVTIAHGSDISAELEMPSDAAVCGQDMDAKLTMITTPAKRKVVLRPMFVCVGW